MKSLDRVRQDLKRELDDLQKKIQLKRDESDSLQRKFKVNLDYTIMNVYSHVYLYSLVADYSLKLVKVAGLVQCFMMI